MKNIKLLIWDLDETFWKGTLSEEGIEIQERNINIVKTLNRRGIVNSICSKNDFIKTKAVLNDMEMWGEFIFPVINWNSKGPAINEIIKKCQLRPENVLFIDDNHLNIKEVEYFNPNINACFPDILDCILSHPGLKGKNDSELSRLKQYKILEEKDKSRVDNNISNLEFLKTSEIVIQIDHDITTHLDRIVELEERTNQLNFTKLRLSKTELEEDIKSIKNKEDAGAIFVSDKYGDYGLVGFFCVINKRVKHLSFSCRILNMHIESYVYNVTLNSPTIKISGQVSGSIDKIEDYDFITHKNINISDIDNPINKLEKVLFVGGCDLEVSAHYFSSNFDVIKDFNGVNKHGVSVHKEHTNIIKLANKLINDVSFMDSAKDIYSDNYFISLDEIKNQKIFTEDWNILIYSPLNDFSRGLYRSKTNHACIIPLDSYERDWTTDSLTDIPLHFKSLDKDAFINLKENFDFIGPISLKEFEDNLNWLCNRFSDKKIILLTGAEIEPDSIPDFEISMCERHKELNSIILEVAEKYSNVQVVRVDLLVKNSRDLSDNIRHYSKKTYFNIAKDINISIKKSGADQLPLGYRHYAKFLTGKVIKKIKRIILAK
jgi:FkbH-like protein